jgi:hypothetical protein
MKIKEKITLSVLVLILFSCSGPKELYNLNIPLSDEYAISNDGKFSIQVPLGWFIMNSASISSDREIRIMSLDSSSYLMISELRTSYDVREVSDEDKLGVIGSISFEMKKEYLKDSLKMLLPAELFKVNGFNSYGYLFTKNNSRDTCRVVILDTGKRYFEFTILPIPKPDTKSAWGNDQLFSTQQTILKTFRYK